MTAKAAQTETLSAKLVQRWEEAGRKLISLAGEFPAGRYDYTPADGVRTVGDVLRHVAFWNRYVAARMRGEEFDDAPNQLSRTDYASKARVLEALQDSFEESASAVRARNAGLDPETAATLVAFLEHTGEHYGQLAIYARLNGIVPPASRNS